MRITFPAPSQRPKILRKVTVKNMRLGSSPNDELTASGTLFASFGLPRELSGLTPFLDIRKLWPDTLVFDGLPPPHVSGIRSQAGATRPLPPLPDPLPEGAFARIIPRDWLDASMLPDNGDEEDGVRVRWVTAQIIDVPLDILPGRDAEFQAFVDKIIASKGAGALAGVRGTASIGLRVDGIPLPKSPAVSNHKDEEQYIELSGLAFDGSFYVGRKSFSQWKPRPWLKKSVESVARP